MLGTGVRCNKLLKIIAFSLFVLYLWKLPPTLAPAAYSHGSLTKQWPRKCETHDQTVSMCYITALLWGINPHYCHL